jgi:hypothetical protein
MLNNEHIKAIDVSISEKWFFRLYKFSQPQSVLKDVECTEVNKMLWRENA